MANAEVWLWVDFACRSGEVCERLCGALEGSGHTGCEETAAEGAAVRLRAYWEVATGPEAVRVAAEAAAAEAGATRLALGRQEREDWLALWKTFFVPVHAAPHIWVCPPWDVREPAPGVHVVIIDPKMAFGTGHHATTQLCLQLLEAHVREGDTVVDVGTGSGILAIAAAKLGAARVLGVDPDPEAIRNAEENVAANGVAARVRLRTEAFCASTATGADVVVCNMITAKLLPLVSQLARAAAPAGTVIVSGIGREHVAEATAAIRDAGQRVDAVLDAAEWAAFVYSGRNVGR